MALDAINQLLAIFDLSSVIHGEHDARGLVPSSQMNKSLETRKIGLNQDIRTSTRRSALVSGELERLARSLSCDAAGYDDGRIRIDSSVVRGLEYYTGPVFEAEITSR